VTPLSQAWWTFVLTGEETSRHRYVESIYWHLLSRQRFPCVPGTEHT
jgi:hypothetical protein